MSSDSPIKLRLLLSSLIVAVLLLVSTFFLVKPEAASQSILLEPQTAILLAGTAESTSPAKSLMTGRFQVRLQPGESLFLLFQRLNLEPQSIGSLLADLSEEQRAALSRLPIGTQIYITLSESEELRELIVLDSPLAGTKYFRRNDGSFAAAAYQAQYTTEYKYLGGEISNSLYQDGVNQGMTGAMVLSFAEVFAYDIDFANDVRVGDRYSLLLEEIFVENRSVGREVITIAEFVNRGNSIVALRYVNEEGEIGYYTPTGESMRSRFLRMPISLARVSSNFNPRRLHPVLKVVRPHKGVDFAARTGTPVFSTGNGRISAIGVNGGYGKTIEINHGDGYSTLYAHLNGYARGMRKGKSVKQGQVIGYVGNTGLSTGPHLHYEFRVRGEHQDPLKVRLARTAKLSPEELPAFLEYSEPLLAKYYSYRDSAKINEGESSERGVGIVSRE